MRHERSSSTVVIVLGLGLGLAILVQGFMPPAAPPQPGLQRPQRRRASAARIGVGMTAASDGANRDSKTVARAAAESTELLLALGQAANNPAEKNPAHFNRAAVEAAGLLGDVAGDGVEGAEKEERAAEEESCWVEDSAELLSKGAGAIGAGVKSVALASKPLKREASGRLVPDGQGLLNLCILVFSGLWAVHSIVTADAESWRGWTFQETLMRLPEANWDNYEMGLIEHPVFTKTAINVGIYLIGDWLSQVNYFKDENLPAWEFDLQRTLRNGLIGAVFGPLAHYYYDFSDWVLPPAVPINRPFKIMMDQSVYFCSKCTVYISLVSLLRGDTLEETREALDTRLKGVVTTGWRFWPFVHIFTYFLIPPRHRVLWVNCVDLLWSSIMSGLTSGSRAIDEGGSEDHAEGEGGGGVVLDAVDEAIASSSSALPAVGGSSASAPASATAEKLRAKV